MPTTLPTSIPAAQLVQINPSVLSAAGDAIDINGLMLTTSTRAPIGQVLQFATADDVSNYFGGTSNEAAQAGVYFDGTTVSTVLPGTLLFSQYPITNVSAYLRGASVSALTLTALQALSGSITVTIDGVVKTAASVSLSAATSFSNAAEIIGQALGIEGTTQGTVTASVGGTFTCTSSGTTLTVGTVLTGSLQTSDVVSGTDGTNSLPAGCNIISQLTGTAGGTGTYRLSAAATPGSLSSTTVTSLSTTLNVTVDSGTVISAGDVLSGTGITVNTYVLAQISGATGGIGLYSLSTAQTAPSTTVTVHSPGCTFDSIASAFIVVSGTAGAASTITAATGTLAASINLTAAAGAVTSQGAIPYTPAAAMNSIVAATSDWAGFETLFDPDGGSGNTEKLLFAQWTSQQNKRYFYVAWDKDPTPTTTVPATTSLGYLLIANGYEGTIAIWEPSDLKLASLILAWAASIDFNQIGGNTTLAYRMQGGLSPSVIDGTTAENLISNGYNFYGRYSLNNTTFTGVQPGSISGSYKWANSYVNQIWMNANFQLSLLTFLQNTKSVPYGAAGNAQIAQVMASPIKDAGDFGAWSPGQALSGSQIAQVNAMAGANIASVLATRGWYLQIGVSSAATRAARASPPMNFFYTDGGSVQKIVMGSIAVQ